MREYYDLEHELSTQVLEYYAELEVFYEYSGKISLPVGARWKMGPSFIRLGLAEPLASHYETIKEIG